MQNKEIAQNITITIVATLVVNALIMGACWALDRFLYRSL